MDVVLRTPYGEAEISLRNTSDQSTLADVVEHVTGQRSPPIVFVDRRALPTTTRLGASGLLYGSTIETSESDQPPENGVVDLVQIAGRGAGESAILPAGQYVLGIGRRANAPELCLGSVELPSFELTIQNDGAVSVRARSNTIRLNGHPIAVGESASWSTGTLDSSDRVFQIVRRGSFAGIGGARLNARPGHDTIAFNRPHRRTRARTDSLITLRDAAHSGAGDHEDSAIASSWKDIVNGHHGAERDRRRSAQPHVGDLVRRARDTDSRLWERRPDDDDAFQVAIGLADVAWDPPLETPRDIRARAEQIIEECGPLPMVPVSIDFGIERGVAVVGRPEFRSDLARGLVLGAAITHGPADIDVVVLTNLERMPEWEWAKWLPHTRVEGVPRVIFEDKDIRSWIDSVRAEVGGEQEESTTPHLTLVVVDNADLWSERESPLRPLLSDSSPPLRFVVLTDDAEGAPAACSTVLSGTPDLTVSADFIAEGHQVDGIRPFLASADIALTVALDLAPLDDPELPATGMENIPRDLSLSDLLGVDRLDVETLIERWSKAGDHPTSLIGVSTLGPVEINLEEHGPHVLIAGAEANELLRSVVMGLAANHPPSKIQFAFFDFTNGATLGACTQLPHMVWHDSDLNEQQATRVLRCLRAEVRRRGTALGDGHDAEIIDDPSLQKVEPPRLVLIVDEAASAFEKLPSFLSDLVSIARAGQNVGLHLVVVTERPDEAIDSTITAALDLRVALRMTAVESNHVIGTSDAAQLPDDIPGRAYVRLEEHDAPVLLQSARQSQEADAVTGSLLDMRPFVMGRELSSMEHRLARSLTAGNGAELDPKDRSKLNEVVAVMSQAAAVTEPADDLRICPDPLPSILPMQSFFDEHPGDGVPLALVDLPDEQRQEPLWWRPDLGAFVAVGAAGSGRTALLISLALGIAARFSADDVHLYCIDADTGALDPLSQLPHAGGVSHLADIDGVAQLVQILNREVDRRNALADALGGTRRVAEVEPSIVLMVDDIARLRRALESTSAPEGNWSAFERLMAEGQSLGLCLVVTANEPSELTSSIAAPTANQIVLGLDDHSGSERSAIDDTNVVSGRGRRREDGVELQLVMPPDDIAAAIAELDVEAPTERPPLKRAR